MSNSHEKRAMAPVVRPNLVGLMLLSFTIGGCFGPPDLPTELEVFLTGDESQVVPVSTGPEAFANSTWVARRAADPANANDNADDPQTGPYGGSLTGGIFERLTVDEIMFKGRFSDEGVATLITDNHFYLPQQVGDELVVDGAFHVARLPGMTYAAVVFGVQVNNQIGIALPAEIRFLGLPVSKVIVYVWGTLDEAENRLDGIYGYSSDANPIPELFLGDGGDQFPFYATREP